MLPSKPAVLAAVCTLLTSFSTNGQQRPLGPAEVCDDFSAGRYPGLAWTLDDCMDVWAQFEVRLGRLHHRPEVDSWKHTALELREQGSPCLLGSIPGADGVGSTAIRHVATWIFAQEMGCDWLTPRWGKTDLPNADASVTYCHTVVPIEERRSRTATGGVAAKNIRCTVVNWVSYFQFNETSVNWPSSGSVKLISEASKSPEETLLHGINRAKQHLQLARTGSTDQGREQVVFQVNMTTGTHHMIDTRSWNERKRSVTRKVLGEMRENFHRHPRKWYDENPYCLYDLGRLHFAVHVRMGDRHSFTDKHPDYLKRLEEVMSTISHEVTRKGQPEPLFHVFSETAKPCPSEKTGAFSEFPAWPVAIDQVAACPAAEEHDSVFQVHDRDIMLHLDQDVQNALSCMTRADGIVMGCSTFGQISGLFSKGISMFSTHCEGDRTPPQYKMIPPLAVSERGHLWVPIVGSWYDPVLNATHIFGKALDVLLETASGRSLST